MNTFLTSVDQKIIHTCQSSSHWFARFALFLVYFWFGILKVVTESPANPLISSLLERTLPFMSFDTFIVLFGLLEVFIGVLFLMPKATRVAIPLLLFHMVTTVMPLVLLPQVSWAAPFVPTLEGQYMVKNILIIALAIGIASHLKPMGTQHGETAQKTSL